jgi:hypothetical protein
VPGGGHQSRSANATFELAGFGTKHKLASFFEVLMTVQAIAA